MEPQTMAIVVAAVAVAGAGAYYYRRRRSSIDSPEPGAEEYVPNNLVYFPQRQNAS